MGKEDLAGLAVVAALLGPGVRIHEGNAPYPVGLKTARLHGNGFAQVDLAPGVRLHVWDREFPQAQAIHTPIHNHRFSFRSTILLGKLRHTTYNLAPGSTYRAFRAVPRQDEDTVLEPTEAWVDLERPDAREFSPGDTYDFPAGAFHTSESLARTTVTLLTKTGVWTVQPTVLAYTGVTPDNDFNRYSVNKEELQRIVIRAIFRTLGSEQPWIIRCTGGP